MRKNNRKGIWLTPVDKELFTYLHNMKIATVHQINRDIYRYDKINTLHRRLRRLERSGYIKGNSHYDFPKMKIFCLTERGFKDFLSDGTERVIELSSQAVAHDIGLGNIIASLSKAPKVRKYFTENELKSWEIHWQSERLRPFIDARCDGVGVVQLGDHELYFAVEYEASEKAGIRVADIIHKYYTEDAIPGVLLIYKCDKVFKNYVKTEREFLVNQEARDGNKLFYVHYDSLVNDLCFSFTDIQGYKLNLGLEAA